MGDLKLVVGGQDPGAWDDAMTPFDCGGGGGAGAPGGCLFNISSDEEERENLNASRPDDLARLHARLVQLREGVYHPWRGVEDPAACAQVGLNGGFWGPWLSE